MKILPPGFSISPLTRGDLDSVQAIEREAFSLPWSPDAFRYEVGNQRALALAARSGAAVAGYLIGWLVVDEFHLGNLAVGQDFRRRGVASALLAHVHQYLSGRQFRLITLEVRASNSPARRLYDQHGFVPVALRRNYYSDSGEDAVVMLKTLADRVPAPATGT